MNRRQEAERRGHRAETIALWYLRLKGYRLLAQRFKSPVGEVDLIMRKGDTTAFVEVKARRTVDDAILSVTPRQAKRISAAAGLWMGRDKIAATGHCRFDIVCVTTHFWLGFWLTHIKNAFFGDR